MTGNQLATANGNRVHGQYTFPPKANKWHDNSKNKREGKIAKYTLAFIMLYGNSIIISEFKEYVNKVGGAYIQISRRYLSDEPNLMVLVAPDNMIKHVVSTFEKSRFSFKILQKSQTTKFIDVDINNEVRLPNFIKSALKPFYNANEIVLTSILLSVEKDGDVGKIQSIATSSKIFVIDFKDIMAED